MKRFYKQVTVTDTAEGFGIALDGKAVKTPASHILLVKNKDMADILRAEWDAQEKDIVPDRMPANQLVMTSLDRIRERADTIAHILGYIETDLLFYRSEAEPYRTKQAELWDKWVRVIEDKFGVTLKTTDHIESLEQSPLFVEKFEKYLGNLSDLHLTIFETLIDETSSPVLACALVDGHAGSEDLYQAVLVEDLIRAEIYDENKYGAAPDQVKKRNALRQNLEAAEKLLPLI